MNQFDTEKVMHAMNKFGFVYADIDDNRAHEKADQYIRQGFHANVVHKDAGYFVTIDPN